MPQAEICYFYKKKFVDFNMKNTHAHDDIEIMYVASGQCVVATPSGTKTVETGQFIVLGPKVHHALRAGNADIVNIEFRIGNRGFDVSRALHTPGVKERLSVPCEVYTDDGTVYPALRDLIRELHTSNDRFMIELLFQRLILLLGRLGYTAERNLGGKAYVKKAQDYVIHHCDEKISVADLAEHVGINHSYLQNLFRTLNQITITEYINKIRIEKACFLLRNSSKDTTEIALECGFASRQHFGLTFRKIMGCSPRAFRKSDR